VKHLALSVLSYGLFASAGNAAILSTASLGPSTYYLLDEGTWLAKQAEAIALGGELATINNAAENSFLTGAFASFQLNMWIGLTDQAAEGTFVWISGQPVTYTNWFPGEPNNAGGVEHYTDLNWFFGQWNDLSEDQLRAAIVEIQIPEPNSLILVSLGLVGILGLPRRSVVAAWARIAKRGIVDPRTWNTQ
jgi:hypothetical protein